MRKYLLKIALFFAIISIVDYAFGKVCDYLRNHTKGGFSGNVHYICEESSEDIIMMGSSRMRHHYVPQLFENSLGMTCFNAGIDGNGIILCYGFLEMILERYSPKLIIYDVTGFDMYVDDNAKYLDMLRPYYGKPGIADIFQDVDKTEKWKMMSGLYRYNSNLLGLVSDNIHPTQSFEKGYWPSHKVMDYEPEVPEYSKELVRDSLKLSYVIKFISLAKKHNVEIVFAASPTWFGGILQTYNTPVKKICEEENVPFLDYFYDPEILSEKENWSDPVHLNDKGARLFSWQVISGIKLLLNQTSRIE